MEESFGTSSKQNNRAGKDAAHKTGGYHVEKVLNLNEKAESITPNPKSPGVGVFVDLCCLDFITCIDLTCLFLCF